MQYRHILSLLLDHGGNPFAADKDGVAVVRAAAVVENTECLQLLIEKYGKSVTEMSDKQGTTPLMWACQAGNHLHATILLEKEVLIIFKIHISLAILTSVFIRCYIT